MNKRPWPILWMAILQFISPLLYIGVAAFFYQLGPLATAKEIFALTTDLRKFEIFIAPIVLGILILLTKKEGYYVTIFGTIYLIVRGVGEFFASNETDPVFPLILTNIICLGVLSTLLRSKMRSIYFDPRLRWWETSPRFVTNFPAKITRVGAKPMKGIIENIAAGGAGIEPSESGLLKDEVVTLEFQSEGETLHLKAKIIWEKPLATGKIHLGVQWDKSNENTEWSNLRRLIRTLKVNDTPTTRKIETHLSELKEWFAKLAG